MMIEALLIIFLLFTMHNVDCICTKREFTPLSSTTFVGDIMASYGPLTVTQCTKLCRQYPDCLSVNVRWLEFEGGLAYCDLVGWVSLENRINRTGQSLYGKCVQYLQILEKCIGHGHNKTEIYWSWA